MQLRAPFCRDSLSQTPVEFRGRYEMTIPAASAKWSGNFVLKSSRIEIDERSISSSESYPLARPGRTTYCRVGGRFYVDQEKANGTHAVSELERMDHGMALSALSIDLEAARKKGFRLDYLPSSAAAALAGAPPSGFFAFDGSAGFILDNTTLTAEQVLTVSRPVSFQTILRSTPGSKAFDERGRAELDANGRLANPLINRRTINQTMFDKSPTIEPV